jgi:hypothetical protein
LFIDGSSDASISGTGVLMREHLVTSVSAGQMELRRRPREDRMETVA